MGVRKMTDKTKTDSVDMINHPPHYTSCPSGIECIEIAELLPFCLGNAYKYLHRAGLKGDTLTDLKKARFYIKRAWLNDEKIHEKAKNRILKVSEFRTGKMKQLLIGVAYFNDNSKRFRPIFCIFDELIAELEHEQAHNSDLDNRPA